MNEETTVSVFDVVAQGEVAELGNIYERHIQYFELAEIRARRAGAWHSGDRQLPCEGQASTSIRLSHHHVPVIRMGSSSHSSAL